MEIKRLIYDKLTGQFGDPKISILIGPRQVGKTFLLRELEKEAKVKGMSCRYLDLEQPDDLLSLGTTEKEQFDQLTSSGRILLIDELHLLKNISKLFKAVYDSRKKIKIFASGSSALEMHRHLKESLAGRMILNRIFPLSLTELSQLKRFRIEDTLRFGGLPSLVHLSSEEEKIRELQSIVATYIHKDIKGLVREENIRAFNHLIALLADRQGSLFVAANVAGEIGVSKPTVEKYLDILSQTYVCYSVPSYSGNLGNELKKSRKLYLYDLGVRNSIVKDFRPSAKRADGGVLKESFVLTAIIRQLKPNMEVRFWRTKQGEEVDFILVKNRVPFPVEVKSDLPRAEIPTGISKFLARYPDAPGAIIYNDTIQADVPCHGRQVSFLKWEEAESIPFLREVI